MKKSFLTKLSLGAVLSAVAFLPLITLSARGEGGGYHGGGAHVDANRNYNANYGHGDYGNYDHRDNYNYGGYGGYGGGYGGYEGYGGVINPYPDPESQPGMSDDSSALYQSYLRHNNTGY